MTTDIAATIAANGTSDPVTLARALAEHFAARLSGLDVIHGAFHRTTATVDEHGYLVVDVTQVGFDHDDRTVRVLLQPTAPMTVTAPAVTVPAVEPTVSGVGELDLPGPGAA